MGAGSQRAIRVKHVPVKSNVDADLIEQVRTDMDRLRGRLFQLVEAVGLPSKQEHAFKGCIRQTTYDAQADLEIALGVEPQ